MIGSTMQDNQIKLVVQVEVVMGLEEAFGITVEEDSAQSIVTVQDAADLIEDLVCAKSAWVNHDGSEDMILHSRSFSSHPSFQLHRKVVVFFLSKENARKLFSGFYFLIGLWLEVSWHSISTKNRTSIYCVDFACFMSSLQYAVDVFYSERFGILQSVDLNNAVLSS